MKVFSLKAGDTKTLTAVLSRRNGGLSVAPVSVTLRMLVADEVIERALVATASISRWTYKFTAEDHEAIGTGTFDCEVLVTWSDGQEFAPTEGFNQIRIEETL